MPSSLTRSAFPVATILYRAPDRFDVHTVEDFRAAGAACGGDLHLDLGDVRFIDTAALSALLEARTELIGRGHELWLGATSTAARITLELAGLTEALPAADATVGQMAEAA